MWVNVDESTKIRLETEYRRNKVKYQADKDAYEHIYGKAEKKTKRVFKK